MFQKTDVFLQFDKKLEMKVYSDYEILCKKTADEIVENLKKNPKQLLCIAAGHTSLGVLQELVSRYEKKEIDFSQASFIAMDEWINMDVHTEGSCGWFLYEYFIKLVNYPKHQVFFWNGKAGSYDEECKKAVTFIRKHSSDNAIEYLVLGSGMNGHLALNEPGTELDARAHVTQLDEVSAKVGQKYFKEPTSLQGGITLGLAEFKEAKRAVLLINEAKKGAILKKIRNYRSFHKEVPATALYEFENASLYCDQLAFDASEE